MRQWQAPSTLDKSHLLPRGPPIRQNESEGKGKGKRGIVIAKCVNLYVQPGMWESALS